MSLMQYPAQQTEPPAAGLRYVPPLQAGDRLRRDEFERRYFAMRNLKKAELIEGTVYMPSPVSTDRHGAPNADLVGWLTVYRAATPGVQVADNATVRLDADNEVQPDVFMRILPRYGGRTGDEDGFVRGAPELVGEVAASSVSYDLHAKKEVYRRNAVAEYLVWRVDDGAVDWFVLRNGRYETLPIDDAGIVRSEAFPGLWLDTKSLLAGDTAAVLEVLQQGLKTAEHAEFVKRLGEFVRQED